MPFQRSIKYSFLKAVEEKSSSQQPFFPMKRATRNKRILFTLLVLSSILLKLQYKQYSRVTHFSSSSNSSDQVDYHGTQLSRTERDLLQKHSFQLMVGSSFRKVVIVTVASHHVGGYAHNLRCFISQSSKQEVVLFALDQQMMNMANSTNFPSILWKGTVPSQNDLLKTKQQSTVPLHFGTPDFNRLSLSKFDIVRSILRLGLDVIFTDVDIAWCVNIPHRLQEITLKNPQFNIYMQSNFRSEIRKGDLNTGFYYAKSSPEVLSLFDSFSAKFRDNPYKDDQSLFWIYSCRKGKQLSNGNGLSTTIDSDGNNQYQCTWNSSVYIMFLPLKEFPNGFQDPTGRTINQIPEKYYREMCRNRTVSIWHVNYCIGNAKEKHLRRQGMWILDRSGNCETI